MKPRPPRMLEAIFRRLLPGTVREQVAADLAEEWTDEVASQGGWLAARLWYLREAAGILLAYLKERAAGSGARDPGALHRSRKKSAPGRGEGSDRGYGGGAGLLDALGSDLRFTFRSLRRRPGTAVAALLTAALGIGACTSVYSVVHGVLLQDLPYEEPDRVVQLVGIHRGVDMSRYGTISYPNFLDWQEASETLPAMAVFDQWEPVVESDGTRYRVGGGTVTTRWFDVLGVEPHLGRFFTREEEEAPGSAVVLDFGFWQEHFGGSPSALGEELVLNGRAYTVVGVTPPGLEDTGLAGRDFKVPVVWRPTPRYFSTSISRGGRSLQALARIAPGVDLSEAQAEMDAITARLEEAYPEANKNRGVELVRIKEVLVGSVRPALLLLLTAVALVLLIACANVANLLLARATGREREVAMRRALGAGRGRILRQLLTESLVLSALGGAVGVLLAWWGTATMVAMAGPALPRAELVGIHLPVLLFAGGASILTGILFGLWPAMHLGGGDVRSALTETRSATSSRRRNLKQSILVGVETALAVVLLAGAGLTLRSLWALAGEDPGMEPEGVLSLYMELHDDRFEDPEALEAFYRELLPGIEALPGVEAAAATNILPMGGSFDGRGFRIEGRPDPEPGVRQSAEARWVTPGYFRTLGIPVVRGRGLEEGDGPGSERVMVISRDMAERWWAGEEPLGAGIRVFGETWQVVGVVGEVRQESMGRSPEPSMYMPASQSVDPFFRRAVHLVVRGEGAPLEYAPAVRRVVTGSAPSALIEEVRALEEVVASTYRTDRFRTSLLVVLGLAALVLGIVGVYGVVSFMVSSRLPEMGIRITLGARTRQIVSLVLGQGMVPVGAGITAGLLLSAAGGVLPALRAARTDPAGVIRAE